MRQLFVQNNQDGQHRIAVVIPCFNVRQHILGVLGEIGPEVWRIYVVDDCCPENSGDFVSQNVSDPRVEVVRNSINLGVGGATINGILRAIDDGASVIVKLDGDGQISPSLIPRIIRPLVDGSADYAKGNRFHFVRDAKSMPLVRLVGNAALSFVTKLSTGYWGLFDPTNGFFAIEATVASRLPHERLSKRYFFESDMLFRLGLMRACVVDVPMQAVYGDEKSGMSPLLEISRFTKGHAINFCKRLAYQYFIRDFNLASLQFLLAIVLIPFGVITGILHWSPHGVTASAGTVMLAAMPIIIGMQMLLGFFGYDMASTPRTPIAKYLR